MGSEMCIRDRAMVPVINAVEEFSFGQGRRKLVQDVAMKLQSFTDEVVKKTGGGDKVQELVIFKALASLYASCHRAETARVSSDSNAERDNVSLDPVWENFETKVSMVEALMGFESDAVAAPQDTQAPAVEAAATVTQEAPVQQAEAEKPAASNGGGPMGFFKKPDADAPPVPASDEPAPVTESAPAAATTETPKSDAGASASPMGFFKPGAKKEES